MGHMPDEATLAAAHFDEAAVGKGEQEAHACLVHGACTCSHNFFVATTVAAHLGEASGWDMSMMRRGRSPADQDMLGRNAGSAIQSAMHLVVSAMCASNESEAVCVPVQAAWGRQWVQWVQGSGLKAVGCKPSVQGSSGLEAVGLRVQCGELKAMGARQCV
eukprot:scaffold302265_cov21-Tisochrysis_lutea.AAC.1